MNCHLSDLGALRHLLETKDHKEKLEKQKIQRERKEENNNSGLSGWGGCRSAVMRGSAVNLSRSKKCTHGGWEERKVARDEWPDENPGKGRDR